MYATRRDPRSPRTALGLALLIVLGAQLGAAETWFESYHKAEQAMAEQRWAEAVSHLSSALQEKPSSEANARTYGMRFVEYLPYLKLANAYLRLGQLEAASQALETEERQGAVHSSAEAMAELEATRARLQTAIAEADEQRKARAEALVASSLSAAQQHERDDRLDEALEAIAVVLAAVPDHPQATEIRERLLRSLGERQRQLELDQRFAALRDQGKAELDKGRLREAAGTLTRALEIKEDPEVRRLLSRAQQDLRAEILARQGSEQRASLIAANLEKARELEASGDLLGALRELQAVLALSPGHDVAMRIQQRVVRTRARAEDQSSREESNRRLLDEAETLLGRRSFRQAMARANQILAQAPQHAEALQLLARAYSGLGESLLDPGNAPPVIVVDAIDETLPDEYQLGQVRQPELVITGRVYDGTPVEVGYELNGVPGNQVQIRQRQSQGLWITELRLGLRLEAGPSTIAITATDEAGIAATELYTVDYDVPFVRSIWMPIIVAGAAVLLPLAAVVRRRRTRRRLLRRRFNPYVAGAPILEQQRYFGREKLLGYVLRRIANNSILLYGERRIGKTSFQHQLKQKLTSMDDPEHEFIPIFIDIQGTPEERFFATLATEIYEELGPRLDGLEPRFVRDGDGYSYRAFVKDVHAVLKVLRSQSAKKVKLVLLIDEVDELNYYDPRINQKLRSLFMRTFAENLVSVVSGVAIKKHWEREGSPWYNFFQEIEVEPLHHEAARDLIEEPVRGVFDYEKGVAETIILRTGGKPYAIQRMCSVLVDRMHEEGRQRITMADLDSVSQTESMR